MDRVVNKKSVLKRCNTCNRQEKKPKKKCMCPPIKKRGKNVRKSMEKVKKIVRNGNLLNEWAENECSRQEIYELPKVLRSVKKVNSDDSIVYIGSYQENRGRNITPIIDLTRCASENVHEKVNLMHGATLKTIYFPTRNFDRNIKLRKSMATTSLITLPIMQKQILPRRLNSTTFLNCETKGKLSVLDIPEEYLDDPDMSTESSSCFERTKLTSSDYKMIDWILDVERRVDLSLSPSTSGYNSSLGTDTSIEKMCNIYNVDSKDRLNHI